MAGNFISLQDQGYYEPGAAIQDSVRQYLAAQQQKQQTDEQAQQFAVEQAVRKANAQPQIDPASVAARIIAARSGAQTGASNAQDLQNLPYFQRLAIAAGHLPFGQVQSTAPGANGATVTQDQTMLPSGNKIDGATYAPFSGSQNTNTPTPQASSSTVTGKGPGYITYQGVQYGAKDPSVPLIKPDGSVNMDNAVPLKNEGGIRPISPLRGTAASIAEEMRASGMPEDRIQAALQLMANNQGSATVKDPNSPKPGSPEEWIQKANDSSLPDPVRKAYQQLLNNKSAAQPKPNTPPAKPDVAAQILAGLGIKRPAPATNNQSGLGTSAADGGPAPGAVTTGGPTMPGTPPAVPSTTPGANGNLPKIDPSKFQTGKVYKDANGNRATWNGTRFDPL